MKNILRFYRCRQNHPLQRLGQRGQILFLFGVIYIAVGASLVVTSDDPTNAVIYRHIIELAPLEFWGGIWIAVGLTAVITAFWGIGRDAWGFAAVTFWTICWDVQTLFIATTIPRLIIGLAVWSALAGISMIVAGMRGPDDD